MTPHTTAPQSNDAYIAALKRLLDNEVLRYETYGFRFAGDAANLDKVTEAKLRPLLKSTGYEGHDLLLALNGDRAREIAAHTIAAVARGYAR